MGLRTRKLRAGLSALGIAIGVAAIVAVLGLSSSAKAGLLAQIQALGTNLLTVQNGQAIGGGTAELPVTAPAMITRLPGVTDVQDTAATTASAYRSPLIPAIDTNALSVDAASLRLPAGVGHVPGLRHLPERGHRPRAGRGAGRRRRAVPGHRQDLARRADLDHRRAGRRDVVLPGRDP